MPNESPLAPLLVSEREAARLLACCAKTIFNLRRAGELPAVKIGSSIRYAVSDLQDFVARKKEAALACVDEGVSA